MIVRGLRIDMKRDSKGRILPEPDRKKVCLSLNGPEYDRFKERCRSEGFIISGRMDILIRRDNEMFERKPRR